MLISAQNRSATLTQTTLNATGETFKDVFFDTSDTIKKSETYYVEFTCKKDYPQVQDVYLTGTAVSGSGDIVITVYGKKFTGSDYTSIGTSTWNSALPLDEVITISTSNRYRYYKVEFVSDTTTKKVLLTDMRFKTWLTGGDLSTASLSLSSNLAVTGTTTLTGAVGSAASITLGAGADLIGSTTSDINFGSGNFTVAGASGNTVTKGTIGSGKISSTGGISLTTNVTQFTELVTLTATEIIGTDPGDLGHADGAILVAAPAGGTVLQFVSAILIYDYASAAYTDGGNDMVINIGSTGAQLAVVKTIASSFLLGASADKMYTPYVEYSGGVGLAVTAGEALSLKSTAWTQPSTAAGVIRCYITYNVITTGL